VIARLVLLALALAACRTVEAHYERTVSGSVELEPWGMLACHDSAPISDALGWRCLDGEGDFTCTGSSCQVELDPGGIDVSHRGTRSTESTRQLHHGQAVHLWPHTRVRIGAALVAHHPNQERDDEHHP
jgi:hypothetical protein